MSQSSHLQRRNFLKLMGAMPAAEIAPAWAQERAVYLLDQSGAAPVRLAAEKLKAALAKHGATLEPVSDLAQAKGLVIVLAGPGSPLAAHFPAAAANWASPDCLRLVPGEAEGHPALLVSATDALGFVYGLHELAERVEFGGPVALHLKERIEETSPNRVRSVARPFLSEIEDKAWFYDRQGWRDYLDMLVAARFNRFNFALGFGYDFPKGVTGDYLPLSLSLSGRGARLQRHHHAGLAAGRAGEKSRHLEIHRPRNRRARAGFPAGPLDPCLAMDRQPQVRPCHPRPETGGKADWAKGAAYSRDALAILLKECPEITGITLRVHGESGVPEGTYPFWQTLFEAIAKAGRKIEIDMHAKGINQIMIDMATKTGQPVKVGPKFSAEHQSLAYHQADIREFEIPRADRMEQGVFNVSNGERRFTRYGYADLYQEGRGFDILYRLWPGTQQHLLSGDPAWAAALGTGGAFLRRGRAGDLRAADLQGPRRLRPSGRAQCLCGRRRGQRFGLAQIRRQLPAVGTAALQSRRHAGCLAQQPEAQFWQVGGRGGTGAGLGQPDSAADHQRASGLGLQPFLLAGDLFQPADRRWHQLCALHRHVRAAGLRQCQPAGSAAFLHHRRTCQ